MPILTKTTPDGVTFTFNPLSQQWTAAKAEKKPTSSESLSTLQDRIKKWEVVPGKDPKAPAAELATTGLAGIPRLSSLYDLPRLVAQGITGKLDWTADGCALVRYQETGSTSWQSARLNVLLLDPRTFEKEDTDYWQAVSFLEHSEREIRAAEVRLAKAWSEQKSKTSSVINFGGRERARFAKEGDPYADGRPIIWKSVPSAPQYENRDYASISSAWPVLTNATNTAYPTEEDLASWNTLPDGSISHPTGVRLVIENISQMSAYFNIFRPSPDPQGEEQLIYRDHDFGLAFRLAELTTQVIEQNLPVVEEWRGESSQWLQYSSGVSWPTLVKSQALGLIFTKETHESQDRIKPFVLQTSIKMSSFSGDVSSMDYPVWNLSSNKYDLVYFPPSPVDALLSQVKNLRDWKKKLEDGLESVIETGPKRFDAMHQAALNQAYGDVGDAEPCDAQTAAIRLKRYFERLAVKAENSPKSKELAEMIGSIKTTVENDASPAKKNRSPRVSH